MVIESKKSETFPEAYATLVYCILDEVLVPLKNVEENGPGATTLTVGTVVYSGGASVVNIAPLATGALAGLLPGGSDVSPVMA